ncbi:MAG: cytochrome c [Planctomycetes bacterium]|nr:cytochrome c [Planctomycetota bacterium]
MQPNPLSAPLLVVLASCFLIGVAACSGDDGGTQPLGAPKKPVAASKISAADRAEAKKTFETICFTCHGMQGKGDGPGSAALDPKPRDLSNAEWQKTISDDHIRNVITMGGVAVGKSPMMPAQPQLKGTPKVLDALVEHVRNLAK